MACALGALVSENLVRQGRPPSRDGLSRARRLGVDRDAAAC
jgi:hypothetical protein